MCAGTVVDPPVAVSAASVSVTSRSRSVAFSDNCAFSARSRTLPRIGIVLRRSTTRCTWPSDFRSCARSTVTFIAISARSTSLSGSAGRTFSERRGRWHPIAGLSGALKWRGWTASSRDRRPIPTLWNTAGDKNDPLPQRASDEAGEGARSPSGERVENLFLQLPLQRFHLFGQRGVFG